MVREVFKDNAPFAAAEKSFLGGAFFFRRQSRRLSLLKLPEPLIYAQLFNSSCAVMPPDAAKSLFEGV